MKITINTEVLQREHLSLREFLLLLTGFFDTNYDNVYNTLAEEGLIQRDYYGNTVILSDNTKNLVAKILTASDDKVANSSIDFTNLAIRLRAIYPEGNKPGTTYLWRGDFKDIIYKLQALIAFHNFTFTEEEALNATKQYVESFIDTSHMKILKNFILKTMTDSYNNKEIDSPFMTIIENNRDNENNN